MFVVMSTRENIRLIARIPYHHNHFAVFSLSTYLYFPCLCMCEHTILDEHIMLIRITPPPPPPTHTHTHGRTGIYNLHLTSHFSLIAVRNMSGMRECGGWANKILSVTGKAKGFQIRLAFSQYAQMLAFQSCLSSLSHHLRPSWI